MGFFQQLQRDMRLYGRVAVDIVQYYCLVKLIQEYVGDLEIVRAARPSLYAQDAAACMRACSE